MPEAADVIEPSLVESSLEVIAFAVDMVGVTIILYGFVVGLISYVRAVSYSGAIQAKYDRYQAVRCRMGIHLVLGLEFMIVSDVLTSVVSRTLEDLAYLGAIVVIRTVLAYFLGREMAEVSERLAAR